jgi:hypothetical protein
MNAPLRPALALAFILALLGAGCGGREAPSRGSGEAHDHDHDHEHDGHGAPVFLAEVAIGDFTFLAERHGPILPGKEGAVSLRPVSGPPGRDPTKLNLFLHAVDAEDRQISAASELLVEDGLPHFHVLAREGRGAPAKLVLRLRTADGKDIETSFAIDPGTAEEASGHGPRDGMLAAVRGTGGRIQGYVELKLHDDKGDLELWIARDVRMTEPWDLALDATPTVAFEERQKTVTLRVRDRERNEDEDGTPNVRDGRTNYFIFPGETGADASWLVGGSFYDHVTVSFPGGKSDEFALAPHAHAAGERDG